MKNEMEKDILKVLYSEEEIRARVQEMGNALGEQFQGEPLFLGVLKRLFCVHVGPGPGLSGEKRCGVYRRVLLWQRH